MKKLILLGALSVLFYSAPGHAGWDGTLPDLLGGLAKIVQEQKEKGETQGKELGLRLEKGIVEKTLAEAVKAGKLEAAESTLLAKDVNDAVAAAGFSSNIQAGLVHLSPTEIAANQVAGIAAKAGAPPAVCQEIVIEMIRGKSTSTISRKNQETQRRSSKSKSSRPINGKKSKRRISKRRLFINLKNRRRIVLIKLSFSFFRWYI